MGCQPRRDTGDPLMGVQPGRDSGDPPADRGTAQPHTGTAESPTLTGQGVQRGLRSPASQDAATARGEDSRRQTFSRPSSVRRRSLKLREIPEESRWRRDRWGSEFTDHSDVPSPATRRRSLDTTSNVFIPRRASEPRLPSVTRHHVIAGLGRDVGATSPSHDHRRPPSDLQSQFLFDASPARSHVDVRVELSSPAEMGTLSGDVTNCDVSSVVYTADSPSEGSGVQLL